MEPVAALVGSLGTAGALLLLFLLPGLTLGPLVAPGASTPLARIGRAAGVSLLATSVLCTVLAVLGLLRPALVVALLVGVTILPLVRRPRRRPRLPSRRARFWWIGAILAAIVALVLVVLPSREQVGPSLLPFSSTVWYYTNLAQEVGATGGFPATMPEWGAERPFQSDYMPVTAHTAAAFQLLAGNVLFEMEVYRLAILVVGLIVAILLFRRWVSTWMAVLGGCFLLATERLDQKFLSYRPESVALVLALFGLWLVDRALTERTRPLWISSAVTGGVVFLSHAEVFLIWVAAIAGLAVGRWLVAPGGTPDAATGEAATGRRRVPSLVRRRLGLRRPDRRSLRVPLGAAGIVAAAGVIGIVGNIGLTGEARILSYVTEERTERPPVAVEPRAGEVPDNWVFTDDPTWDFYVAAARPAQLGMEAPSSFTDSRLLPRAILRVWSGLDARAPTLLVVLAALLALPILAWLYLDARRRRLVLTWYVFGVALAVGSVILFVMSDTYVPQRVGPRRLMPYELFPPVAAAVIGIWIVDRLARSGWAALLPRRGRMVAAGVALSILGAGVVSAGEAVNPDAPDEVEAGLTLAGYEAYGWIAGNTPADARILANAYTDGSLSALTGRVGIVDGRAVYLEDREVLAESTALILGARVVFAEPDGAAAGAYLARNGVDYLLVAGPEANGTDLGGYALFETDLAALASSDRYTHVATFGDQRLFLFEVSLTP